MGHRKARILESSPVTLGQAGSASATIKPGRQGPPERDDGLLLRFRFDHDPPTSVSVKAKGHERDLSCRRLGSNRWWFDLEGVHEAGRYAVSWRAPAAGGVLCGASFCDANEAADETYDVLRAYRRVLGEQLTGAEPVGGPSFFCKLDLVTAFAELREEGLVKQAAALLGLRRELLEAPGLEAVDALRQVLCERWRLRAVAHAAGLPPAHLLPWVGGLQRTAEQLVVLVLAVLRGEVEASGRPWDGLACWHQVLRFASGALRLPDSGERFNCQPNSVAFACFAELFSLGCHSHTALGERDLADCRDLRLFFVSALEPFFDSYVAAQARPRRARHYVSANLHPAARPDPQRWGHERRSALIRDYRRHHGLGPKEGAAADGSDVAWLERRWGEVLLRGLADEPSVAAVSALRR